MFDPIIVNGEILEVVDSAKILDLSVSNNLKWNNQIDQIISKARKRLYCSPYLHVRERDATCVF